MVGLGSSDGSIPASSLAAGHWGCAAETRVGLLARNGGGRVVEEVGLVVGGGGAIVSKMGFVGVTKVW